MFIHPIDEIVRGIIEHGDQRIFFRAPVGREIEWHFYSFLEKKTGEHFCTPAFLLTDAGILQNYIEFISIQLPDFTGDCLLDYHPLAYIL